MLGASQVLEVPLAQVLDQRAYMLFYVRTDVRLCARVAGRGCARA
jgi:hypothetical protein